jgi:hypothetical protein
MKVGLIFLALAAIYLVGQLVMTWKTRSDNLPKPPPGGWKKGDWDDEDDDWPKRDG